MKKQLVRDGILRVLEDVNPGRPHGVSQLRKELHEVVGLNVSWDTTKKYAEELVDDGRIRRKKWETENGEYEKVAYLVSENG